MYNFVDPQSNVVSENVLPSERLIFPDGTTLEGLLGGYFQTVSVTGRDLIGNNVKITEIDGFDGGIVTSVNLPVREITIRFRMRGNNPQLHNSLYTNMTTILHQFLDTETEIKFADEPYYYEAILGEVEQPNEGELNTFGKFTLICADPRKFVDIPATVSGEVLSIEPALMASYYQSELKTVSFTGAGSSLYELVNNATNEKITFTNNVPDGVDVVIDLKNHRVLVGGVDLTASYIAWNSNLETIGETTTNGFTLTGTYTNLQGTFRGVAL